MGRTLSGGGRPAWHDRNPISRVDYYPGDDLAPHATTQRLSYTVPAGKKAMVEVLVAFVRRSTAATTVGNALAWWKLTPSGGLAKGFFQARIRTNAVDDKRELAIGATLMMFAGDVLEGSTWDSSTGGTCDYYLSYKLTEFDT